MLSRREYGAERQYLPRADFFFSPYRRQRVMHEELGNTRAARGRDCAVLFNDCRHGRADRRLRHDTIAERESAVTPPGRHFIAG